MLSDDIGDLKRSYERNRINLPDAPGLGIEIDLDKLEHYAESHVALS
jgi:L-alanine-DL-glutamate epimerase-like enolase superfamily enzyme